jgi:sensor histidine kinase YesM
VPLALQLLLENAIKHNVVSATEPLEIRITANEQEITVRNIYQPKMSKEKGEGVGLLNIKKRYGLLTGKPVTYGMQGNEYVVTLPLL